MQDVEKLSEEFEGDVPDIDIKSADGIYFNYICRDSVQTLSSACTGKSPLSDKCFDCIGFNKRFAKYFEDNRRCSCGYKVDYGYFILIFHFDKAGLLPKDFKMMCCHCNNIIIQKMRKEGLPL